jgi:hypothetical protein
MVFCDEKERETIKEHTGGYVSIIKYVILPSESGI